MTKREALREFRRDIQPTVEAFYGVSDKIALRTAWNDWTDCLCKSGRISSEQFRTWTFIG